MSDFDLRSLFNQVEERCKKWGKVMDALERLHEEYSKEHLGNVQKAGQLIEELMVPYSEWKS